MSVFALIFTGIATALLASALKSYKTEYAVYAVIFGGVLLLFFALSDIGDVSEFLSGIISSGGVSDENTSLIFKALGIGYLTQFGSEICFDCGEKGLSSKVDLVGRLTVIGLCIPVVGGFLDTVKGFLGD